MEFKQLKKSNVQKSMSTLYLCSWLKVKLINKIFERRHPIHTGSNIHRRVLERSSRRTPSKSSFRTKFANTKNQHLGTRLNCAYRFNFASPGAVPPQSFRLRYFLSNTLCCLTIAPECFFFSSFASTSSKF